MEQTIRLDVVYCEASGRTRPARVQAERQETVAEWYRRVGREIGREVQQARWAGQADALPPHWTITQALEATDAPLYLDLRPMERPIWWAGLGRGCFHSTPRLTAWGAFWRPSGAGAGGEAFGLTIPQAGGWGYVLAALRDWGGW